MNLSNLENDSPSSSHHDSDDNQKCVAKFALDQKRYTTVAFEITQQEWTGIGTQDDQHPNAKASSDLDETVERVTALLLIRLVALASPSHKFKNLATTTICRSIVNAGNVSSYWPEEITWTVVQELRSYVKKILKGYKKVPYHNFQHAYHVLASSNKLLDIVLKSNSPVSTARSSTSLSFEEDPLMHLSLLFAALIHDVDHQGVPNQQLVLENNKYALQYNDQSVAEQRSLAVGFTELLKSDYENLRDVMFPFTFAGDGYRRFRGAVTDLVLATDIASPERAEIVKKKWTSAFEMSGSTHSRRRSVEGLEYRSKDASATPAIRPPPEHPTPNRPRRRRAMKKGCKDVCPLDQSWVELGDTPSTHFPRKESITSQDSLSFWWFNHEDPNNGEEEADSTDDDDTEFAMSFSTQNTSGKETQGKETQREDLESSITLFPDVKKEKTPLSNGESFSDIFPHASKSSFNLSSSTCGSDSVQHLLSPAVGKRVRRTSSRNSSHSASCEPTIEEGSYFDMSYASGDDSFVESKPSSFSKVMGSCYGKMRGKKGKPLILDEADYCKSKKPADNSQSTFATSDMTETEVSSSSLHFDASVRSSSGVSQKKPEEPQEEENHGLTTISLMEHILLVADVSHTMQGWDIMNKFALRLSKEIKRSIDKGRSGGINNDPLADWYSNQSAFLHGYILPLATRLEKTGFLPVAEGEESTFITKQVNMNFERWQEQGHDVILGWRRSRERKRPSTKSSSRKVISSSDTKKKDKKSSTKTKKSSGKDKDRESSKSSRRPKSKRAILLQD